MARKKIGITVTDIIDKLGLTPKQVSTFLSKIARSSAVTDQFGTIQNGGLISTVIIFLRALQSMTETAGISGVQGDGYMPSFWSGGTYQQAVNFGIIYKAIELKATVPATPIPNLPTPPIVMLHNGITKIGPMIVTDSAIEIVNRQWLTNIRIGDKQGYSVLEFIDDLGNWLYDLGPEGIVKADVVEQKWHEIKLIPLGVFIPEFINVYAKQLIYKNSHNYSTTTYYRFQSKIVAGVVEDPINNGKIFTSRDTTGAPMPSGYYIFKSIDSLNYTYLVGETKARIYPPYINNLNEVVIDANPLYYKDVFYYTPNGPDEQKDFRLYWNDPQIEI